MNPFAGLWASFLSWYYNPSRILDSFDRTQRRLNASANYHDARTTSKQAVISSLQAQVADHQRASARALTVSSKLSDLIAK